MAASLPRASRPSRADVVLACAVLVASLVQIAIAPIAGPVASLTVALGSALPLAFRRVRPLTSALVLTAVWSIPTTDGFLLLGYVIAGLVFYALGAYVPGLWQVLAVGAVAVVVGVVMTLLGPEHPSAAIGAVLIVVGPVSAGRLVAHQRAQTVRLRELTDQLLHERAAAERAAAAEERARIARELHDVVGHEVTVIALQADAAAAALARAPERARVPVETIRAAAAEALAEMRRVVGLLRSPGDDEDLHPQPGLAQIPALVDRARSAGLDVALEVRPVASVPQTLQVAAYRVVQEALTNAGRHSPGSSVRVRLDTDRVALCVEVTSRGGRPGRAPRGGHGLVGMRERVRMLGGTFSAGPTDGGFTVAARLPLVVGVLR